MHKLHFMPIHIRNGAANAQQAMVRTRRQAEPLHGLLEQELGAFADTTEVAQLSSPKLAVESPTACELPGADLAHALPDHDASLLRLLSMLGPQLPAWEPRNLDVHVDAVEQGARDSPPVAAHLVCRAVTATTRVTKVPTWTRIHRGDQLKPSREVRLPRSAGDGDSTGLQRLAQDFEHAAIELGQLV
jgi:hypothetical protein